MLQAQWADISGGMLLMCNWFELGTPGALGICPITKGYLSIEEVEFFVGGGGYNGEK